MSLHVREALPGDEASIVRLIQDLAGQDFDTPITEDYVRTYLAFPGCHVLLAVEQERAIGLLAYSVRPDLFHAGSSCFIEDLVVRSGHRKQGVASALLREVLRQAELLGCAEVSVATLPDNERAQRLYRAHGLVDEALFLEKHLSIPPVSSESQ